MFSIKKNLSSLFGFDEKRKKESGQGAQHATFTPSMPKPNVR